MVVDWGTFTIHTNDCLCFDVLSHLLVVQTRILVDTEGIEPTRLLREGIYSPHRLLNGLRADINSFSGYKETINLNFTQSTQRPFSLYIKQAF